jgi:hypothetical protein
LLKIIWTRHERGGALIPVEPEKLRQEVIRARRRAAVEPGCEWAQVTARQAKGAVEPTKSEVMKIAPRWAILAPDLPDQEHRPRKEKRRCGG